MKLFKTLFIFLASAATVLMTANKAQSVALRIAQSASNPTIANGVQVASTIEIGGAKNIYVVDGINNTLEVFDTNMQFFAFPVGSRVSSINRLGNETEKIYSINGINNTLQVLNTNPILSSSSRTSAQTSTKAGAYLLDDFNKTLTVTDPNTTGLISTSGRREGQLSLPANRPENYYVVDGFNNSLEISNIGDNSSRLRNSAAEALGDFFTGGSSVEDMPGAQLFSLLNNFSNGSESLSQSDRALLENLFESIASGPFANLSEEDLEESIIDSIGNPNRELGWFKNLIIGDVPADNGDSNQLFFLGRSVNTSTWEIDSQISVAAEETSDLYFVDGFNNLLQVIDTSDGQTPGSFHLVDGINNSLHVSDVGSRFSLFGSQSNFPALTGDTGNGNPSTLQPPEGDFLDFLANYTSGNVSSDWLQFLSPELLEDFLAANPSENNNNNVSGEFLYFLATYASGNVPSDLPVRLAFEQLLSQLDSDRSGLPEGLALDQLWDSIDSENGEFSTLTNITANARDVYQVKGINNRIEIGEGIELPTNSELSNWANGVAVDGEGNVYVINGINNRIRVSTEFVTTVPEPSSILVLALLGSGTAACTYCGRQSSASPALKRRATMSPDGTSGKQRAQGNG